MKPLPYHLLSLLACTCTGCAWHGPYVIASFGVGPHLYWVQWLGKN
jgi:hypothetical protein